MTGRRVEKRGMLDDEYEMLVEMLGRHWSEDSPLVLGAKLRQWFHELSVEKYMAGYHTGYKRGLRRSQKEGFDE